MKQQPLKIGLVSCSKSKAEKPTSACELYSSDLAQKSYQHALKSCDQVFFISGALGLVEPEKIIAPYDENRQVELHYYGGVKKVSFLNILQGGIGQRLKWLKERI